MADLKPCPFCGGKAAVIDNGCFVDVSCKNFHCRGWADSLMFKNKEEAIEAWNKRVPQTVVNQNGENCTNITNCGTLNFSL